MVEILLRDFRDGKDGELHWAMEKKKLLGKDAFSVGRFPM